jgi:hypothetical protein
MKLKFFNIFLLGIFVVLFVGCSGTVPIQDLVDAKVTTASEKFTLEDVKRAIITAGRRNDWQMKDVALGHIVATRIAGGSMMAQIDVRYNLKTFNIHYKASNNMDYKGSSIHEKYAEWIEKLHNEIKGRLMLI